MSQSHRRTVRRARARAPFSLVHRDLEPTMFCHAFETLISSSPERQEARSHATLPTWPQRSPGQTVSHWDPADSSPLIPWLH